MAQAFLERFYELVHDYVGDPTTSRRLTKPKMVRDFQTQEKLLWERLLRATGQSSLIGRGQASYDLEADKEFYPLPGNFRQFIAFEKRTSGDPNSVEDRFGSKPYFDGGRGAEIISQERGMRIYPIPTSDDSGWTLIYMKGPIRTHYATAANVGASTITLGTPPTDAGTVCKVTDYYVNSMVRVYDGTIGAPQSCDVVAQSASADMGEITLHLRHPWMPKPTGNVKYEFRPELPDDFDAIYALMVAMDNMPRRNNPTRYRMLQRSYQDLWDGCRSWVLSNVADRAPTRTLPINDDDMALYASDYA